MTLCGEPLFNTTWLEEGKILAGSLPYYPRDLDTLRSMGIVNILSLTRRNFQTYPDMHWGEHMQVAMPDSGIPTNDAAVFALGYIAHIQTNPSMCIVGAA